LWILRELSNIDKHRTLHIASTFLYSPDLEFDPPGAGEITWTRPAGPVSDGDEVVRYRKRPVLTNPRVEGTAFTADLQKVIAETTIGGELVFAETAPASGSKVMVMLDWLLDYVTWVVDLFDYQYFGGNAPAGTKTIVIPATSSATVSEAGDSDS